MKFFFILCGIILCSSACCGTKPIQDDLPEYNKVKPYNPKKAEAVIVKSFDITNKIGFLETEVIAGPPVYYTVKTNYGLAEYNNSIYIMIKKTLYVFDKHSMKKQREIKINLPEKYNFLPNSGISTLDNGLAVTGNHAFMRFLDHSNPPHTSYFFMVNLDTGNAQYISEEELGFNYSDRVENVMGYDKIKDALWFRFEAKGTDRKTNVYIYYIRYDNDTNSFTKIGEAVWGYEINGAIDDTDPRKDSPPARLIASGITGNESWNVYAYPVPRLHEPAFFVVDKRNMDSLTEPISRIRVAHLGTFSLPQSIIYDPPYVWLMVERKNKIQMLKLLPKE